MYLFLTILIVLASILMCFIVMIQNSKGGGLASGFASSNQIMGVRKTTDFLEKTTWGLAIFMAVVSVATAFVLPNGPVASSSVLMQDAQKENVINPVTVPGFDATQQPAETETPAAEETPAN